MHLSTVDGRPDVSVCFWLARPTYSDGHMEAWVDKWETKGGGKSHDGITRSLIISRAASDMLAVRY